MFDDLLDNFEDTERKSKYLDQLSRDERKFIDDFADWLVTGSINGEPNAFKRESARSYKANLARANWKQGQGEAINSDERSAIKKFRAFIDEINAFVNAVEA